MDPHISVVTVTWNSAEHIAAQISSVQNSCKDIVYEQIIIDNASTDDTVKIIEQNFSEVKLIKNTENKGFGFANNQGTQEATGKYILFLNPDMELMQASLGALFDWMELHRDVAIASVKLTDKEGNFNVGTKPRRFPKLYEQLALIFKIPHLFPSLFKNYFYRDFDPTREQEVDSVQGAFFLIRRELIEKLGWAFDPRYYIWYEDVDTCREAKRLLYKVMYIPSIGCIDYGGQSFKKRDTYWKQKQFSKSMLTYFQKWEPWYKWIWIALFRPIGIGLVWCKETVYLMTGFNLQDLSRLEKKKKQGKNF